MDSNKIRPIPLILILLILILDIILWLDVGQDLAILFGRKIINNLFSSVTIIITICISIGIPLVTAFAFRKQTSAMLITNQEQIKSSARLQKIEKLNEHRISRLIKIQDLASEYLSILDILVNYVLDIKKGNRKGEIQELKQKYEQRLYLVTYKIVFLLDSTNDTQKQLKEDLEELPNFAFTHLKEDEVTPNLLDEKFKNITDLMELFASEVWEKIDNSYSNTTLPNNG